MATKIVTADKNGMILLKDFTEFLDMSKVKFYSLKINKDKAISIKFYDNEKKVIKTRSLDE
jgi:hypothetical protein